MINTERNGNGVATGGTGPLKKTALRDVQNENVGSNGESIKVCGTKRLTPERPSSSQGLMSLAYNGTNENVMNARRRFELELGRGRLQNSVERYSDLAESKSKGQKTTPMRDSSWHHVPVIPSSNVTVTPVMSFSSSGQSVHSSLAKNSNSITATKGSTNEEVRTERFVRLQKVLKERDDANQRDYIQMLLRLQPDELSNHAYDLEKRAIQLTIEEGQEMKRMKELNILAKSSPVNNSRHSTPSLQASKR